MKVRSKKPRGKKDRQPKPARNPLRIDPTKSITLRRAFASKLRKQFAILKGQLIKLIDDEDALGLKEQPSILQYNAFCPTGEGGGVDPTCAPGGGAGGSSNPGDVKDAAKAGGGSEKIGLVGKLKATGIAISHVEHAAKQFVSDKITSAVSRLPKPAQTVVKAAYYAGRVGTKAAFASWSAGQALAERVAQERGSTPEQARRLRGVLSTLDVTSFKPLSIGLGSTGMGAAAIGAASLIPPATAGYLAYSTARNPLATYRAAKGLVKKAVGRVASRLPARSKKAPAPRQSFRPGVEELSHNAAVDRTTALVETLEEQGYNDWFIAVLLAALEETQDLTQALEVARQIVGENPEDTSEEADDDVESVLGVTKNALAVTANRQRWMFLSDPQKIEAFKQWLKTQVKGTLTSHQQQDIWQAYVEQGYRKGAGRAFDDVRMAELKVRRPELFMPEAQASVRDFYAGTKDEFLRSAFGQPVAVEKVKLLAGRTFDDLDDITSTMSNRITRVLTDSLVEGRGVREIVRAMVGEVDLGRSRAEVIARTEIIRAHAEGQLDSMQNLGVDEVGVAVEWLVTPDDRLCDECASLEGVVLSIEEARNMLPRHPSCRCAWTPANVGESEKGQSRSKTEVDKAIEKSVAIEGGEEASDWAGADKSIDKSRPHSIFNTALEQFDQFLMGAGK